MESNNNLNILKKREKLALFFINDKGNNYQVTSVYILIDREKLNNKEKNLYSEFLIKNYFEIIELLTYSINDCFYFSLFFDFEKFKNIYQKNIEDNFFLPIPYIIKIHLWDMRHGPYNFHEIILISNKIFKNDNKNGINFIDFKSEKIFKLKKINEENFQKYEIICNSLDK